MTDWVVERVAGHPGDLHAEPLPEPVRRRLVVRRPTHAALVLGSTQGDDHVDRAVAASLGLDVVRRRSGGGAVLVRPGAITWVDVELPAGDPLWDDDVSHSTTWLGRAWVDLLAAQGLAPEVLGPPYAPGPFGAAVCFAGRAPGEVVVDGRKVLGVAQRRTRAGARLQCAVLGAWEPEVVVGLVLPEDRRAEATAALAGAVLPVALDDDAVVDHLRSVG